MHPILLPVAFFLCVACQGVERTSVAGEFITTGSDFANDAGGLSVFGVANEEDVVGGFLTFRITSSGSANGTHYENLPVGAFGDEITGRQVLGIGMTVGPTFRAADWLVLYGGIGFGVIEETVEQFDSTGILDPSGFYTVPGEDETRFAGSAGALVLLSDKVALEVGYDSFFEGAVLGFAMSF